MKEYWHRHASGNKATTQRSEGEVKLGKPAFMVSYEGAQKPHAIGRGREGGFESRGEAAELQERRSLVEEKAPSFSLSSPTYPSS